MNWLIYFFNKKLVLLLSSAFLLTGCFLNQHNFNSGKLLKQGDSKFIWGVSSSSDSLQALSALSLGFELGVLDDFGSFKGLQIGWQLEGSMFAGNISFNALVGLPARNFYHNLGVGWIIGTFIDNTYFLQYGIGSKINEHIILFSNITLNFLATYPNDLIDTDNDLSPGSNLGNRFDFRSLSDRWAPYLVVGLRVLTPNNIFLVPNLLIPNITVLPKVNNVTHKTIIQLGLGLSWSL